MIKWYCSDICVSDCQTDDHFVIIIFLHWLIRCSQGSYRPLYLTLCHSTQYTPHHTNPVTTLAINTKISFPLSRVGTGQSNHSPFDSNNFYFIQFFYSFGCVIKYFFTLFKPILQWKYKQNPLWCWEFSYKIW